MTGAPVEVAPDASSGQQLLEPPEPALVPSRSIEVRVAIVDDLADVLIGQLFGRGHPERPQRRQAPVLAEQPRPALVLELDPTRVERQRRHARTSRVAERDHRQALLQDAQFVGSGATYASHDLCRQTPGAQRQGVTGLRARTSGLTSTSARSSQTRVFGGTARR